MGCSPWGRQESDTTERLHFHALDKEVATHCSVVAWRVPGAGEPGGLPFLGSHRVGHDCSDSAAAAAAKTDETQIIHCSSGFLPQAFIKAGDHIDFEQGLS